MKATIRNCEDLVEQVKRGRRPHYLFFWGHRPLPNGEIGPSCFSQWWPARFAVAEVRYPTAEHFMMAEKARLFDDEDVRTQILDAGSPKTAKELGRRVKNFKEEIWEASRFKLVVE